MSSFINRGNEMRLIERITQELIERGNGDFTDIINSIDCINFRFILQTAYELGQVDGYEAAEDELLTLEQE